MSKSQILMALVISIALAMLDFLGVPGLGDVAIPILSTLQALYPSSLIMFLILVVVVAGWFFIIEIVIRIIALITSRQ